MNILHPLHFCFMLWNMRTIWYIIFLSICLYLYRFYFYVHVDVFYVITDQVDRVKLLM